MVSARLAKFGQSIFDFWRCTELAIYRPIGRAKENV
jgi:hypothetical protein